MTFKEIYSADNVKIVADTLFMNADEQSSPVYSEVVNAITTEWVWLANMGCSVIGSWSTELQSVYAIAAIFAEKTYRYRQELEQLYDGLKRITMTPLTDTTTREKLHSGDSSAMNETSPIDSGASFDITTPNAKAKTEYSSTDKETVSSDTVDEALSRVKALTVYRVRLMDIVQNGLRACCRELIASY